MDVLYRDVAVLDEQGYRRIVGRIKDMIIRGGENIYPREIGEFLHTHPKVKDVQDVDALIRLLDEITPGTDDGRNVPPSFAPEVGTEGGTLSGEIVESAQTELQARPPNSISCWESTTTVCCEHREEIDRLKKEVEDAKSREEQMAASLKDERAENEELKEVVEALKDENSRIKRKNLMLSTSANQVPFRQAWKTQRPIHHQCTNKLTKKRSMHMNLMKAGMLNGECELKTPRYANLHHSLPMPFPHPISLLPNSTNLHPNSTNLYPKLHPNLHPNSTNLHPNSTNLLPKLHPNLPPNSTNLYPNNHRNSTHLQSRGTQMHSCSTSLPHKLFQHLGPNSPQCSSTIQVH
uniref:Uncharacterized protein n=1 Tax=Branchiostoma floridae TaxID=7739 RepID=C3YIT6_BRAFL|eukprot:XP_002603799.1 hypothetical protein BRAFLDRAFT_86630 [Branchiostoma floridae]